MKGQRSVIQYDEDSDEDDDDVSLVDDEDEEDGSFDMRMAGRSLTSQPERRGGGFGQGGGFGGSGSGVGGDPYAFDYGGGAGGGGGGDPYAFDFKFDSNKAYSPDLDLDGGPLPKSKAATASSGRAGGYPSKSAAPAGAKPPAVTSMRLDVDDKYKRLMGGGAGPKTTAAGAAAPAAKGPVGKSFDDFLADSDDSDLGVPAPAPSRATASNAPGAGRAQASSAPAATEAPAREERSGRSKSKGPSPLAEQSSAFADAAAAFGSDVKRSAGAAPEEDSEVSSFAPDSPQNQQRQQPPSSSPAAASRDNSASPAETPRAGFARGDGAADASSPVSSARSRSSGGEPSAMGKVMQMDDLPKPSTMGKVMQMDDLPKPSTMGKVMEMGDLPSASRSSTMGQVRSMADLPQPGGRKSPVSPVASSPASSTASDHRAPVNATSAATAAAAQSRPPAVLASAVPEIDSSVSQLSPQHATGTYTEDFLGESNAQGATYAEDFDEFSEAEESRSSTPRSKQGAALLAEAKPKLMTMASLPVPVAKASVSAPSASVPAVAAKVEGLSRGTDRVAEARRRRDHSDESDDDYRPRRPTCSIGVQAAVPVDVGIQCELQQESRAPDDPFGPWMQQTHTSLGSSATAGPAGFPSAMPPCGMPPHPYFNGYPSGGFAHPYMTMPQSPYPYWGGCMMPPQQMPPQQMQQMAPSHFGAQLGAPNPLLRQLLGAAIAPRVGAFNPHVHAASSSSAPREAGAAASAHEEAASASAPGASPSASMAGGSGMPFPQAFSMPYVQQGMGSLGAVPGVGAQPFGGASPAAMAALGLVDESFREQIELLRKAAARHRSLLEKATAEA